MAGSCVQQWLLCRVLHLEDPSFSGKLKRWNKRHKKIKDIIKVRVETSPIRPISMITKMFSVGGIAGTRKKQINSERKAPTHLHKVHVQDKFFINGSVTKRLNKQTGELQWVRLLA